MGVYILYIIRIIYYIFIVKEIVCEIEGLRGKEQKNLPTYSSEQILESFAKISKNYHSLFWLLNILPDPVSSHSALTPNSFTIG